MGQHADEHVMIPSKVLANLILIHAQFAFGFFKALFNGPAQAAQPDKQCQSRAEGRIADKECICGIRSQGAFHDQPDFPSRQPVFGKNRSALGELIFDGPLGSFGYGATIPEETVDGASQFDERERFFFSGSKRLFRPCFSSVPVFFFNGCRSAQPAFCIARDAQKTDLVNIRRYVIDKFRAVAV